MLSKYILVLSIFLLPFTLSAKKMTEELEARSGDTAIRISGGKCTNKVVLDLLKPEHHAKFKSAELRANGKPIKGCWTMDDQGVFIILEDGDQGYVPTEKFKPVDTI